MRLIITVLFLSFSLFAKEHSTSTEKVTVTPSNYVRAATDIQFGDLLKLSGEVNKLHHNRSATPIDQQPVIRMNRDTLYSSAIVDISKGAKVFLPDSGDRYMSVMIVNQDHYINKIFHNEGTYTLKPSEFDTPFVSVNVRILADPNDPEDLKKVHKLQDAIKISAESKRDFTHPQYDKKSLKAVGDALKKLGEYGSLSTKTFGKKSDVNPVDHLIGTAVGWGGLPSYEAIYDTRQPNLPVGEYKITVHDVPVEHFWSVTVYNKDGFFEKNKFDSYSVNNITGEKGQDGSITVHFGGCDDGRVNCIPVTEGWNYTARFYGPGDEILSGSYEFPKPEPVTSELAE